MPPSRPEPRWIPEEIAGESFERINLEHEEVGARVVEEIRSDVDVYYDRRWSLTRELCAFLLQRPGLLEGRRIYVAGAGVGMEAVVAGALGREVVVNDVAPVALELLAEQLERNGVEAYRVHHGPCQEADLEGVELVLACFVVYDPETRDAVARLLERAAGRGVPALLANEDIGGHFTDLLEDLDGPVRDLDPGGRGRIVWVG